MFCRGLGSISVTAGGDFIKTDENLNTVSSDFDLTCNTIWKYVWQPVAFFQHDNDPEHTVNAVDASLNRRTHNGILSVMDRPPPSPDRNTIIPQKAANAQSRSLSGCWKAWRATLKTT